jgi:hypothetical protein
MTIEPLLNSNNAADIPSAPPTKDEENVWVHSKAPGPGCTAAHEQSSRALGEIRQRERPRAMTEERTALALARLHPHADD